MNKERPKLRAYFVTGLLIWVPLAITFWVLSLIVGMMDQSLAWLPGRWQSEVLFGLRVPGLGVLLTLGVIFATGFLATNFVGARLLLVWEGLLQRIPVVRTIYSSVKQVSDTLLSSSGQAFRKAVLVQYPRTGAWTIAFQTGTPVPEVLAKVSPHMISVYVPTTPNPTPGFFLMLPRADVIELSMSVDEALKYVISMGVVGPGAAAGGNGGTKIQIED